MSALSKYLPTIPPPPPVLLARGDVFFTRRVALATGEPVDAQITLALEGMAPFPPEQLYCGNVVSGDGRSALIFAAFRRRFSAEETEAWEGAALVTAEFVPLLAKKPAGDGIVVHSGEGRVTALAWKQGEELPAVVLVRIGGAEAAAALAAEARSRAELSIYAEILHLEGRPALRPHGEAGYEGWLGDTHLGPLGQTWGGTADVRDPDFLAEQRRAHVRDLWLWRGLLGAAAILILAAIIDLSSGVLGYLTTRREARVAEQTAPVAQIEEAQSLANRIAELSKNRLMPFEMLALINPSRPDSIVFQSIVTRGLLSLEVSAQAANASDVGSYSNALKALPSIATVTTGEVRARDGVTTFVLTLEFKPEALRNGGAL